MGKEKKNRKLYFIMLPFAVILLALGIVVDALYPQYSQVVNNALGTESRADDEYVEEALANSKEVGIRLEEEGAVLLKNEDGALPITDTDKVNVYGILSAHHYTSGTGSSAAASSATVDLKTALESAGFEIANPDVWSMLEKTSLGSAPGGSTVGQSVAGQYELDVSDYTGIESFAAARSNSRYAIVTFGTNGGEGSDGDRSEDSNSMQLGENETALLKALDEAGFTIVALMNSAYVMEIGPVEQYADAILWIGGTGLYGTLGAANILKGTVNPSGRTVDTWPYYHKYSSTYYTSDSADAHYVDENGKEIGSYTNYNEGIYMGYKWFETADAEGYWDDVDNEYGSAYDGVVAYPFGYGLSYTTFEEDIVSYTHEAGVSTFEIEATNTGDVAGMDVVELYVEKPYTNGGIEVAKTELVGFAKTASLEPGASERVTLTVKDEDLAVYNSKHSNSDGTTGCYVLQGGEYAFYLASGETGAHCWADENAPRESFTQSGDIYYEGDNKRSSDYVAASNMLERTDNDTGVSLADTTAGFNELSRADGFANASETISKEANTTSDGKINGAVVVSSDSAIYKAMTANYGSNTYTNFNTAHLSSVSEFTNTALGQKQKYTLADMYTTDADGNPLYEIDEDGNKTILGSVDYDDPRWDYLISQMTVDEVQELIGNGGYGTIAVDSIGKKSTTEYDGPTGFTNFLKASLNIDQDTTGFCSEPIMAATWDVDLIVEFGEAVGMEGNAFSNSGWYAPGMNMHRTAFAGRTGEYFSEDSYLTGKMAESVAEGAMNKGVYTYAKHFMFNEIEANRESGMNCVMSEQAAREIYLRPFEIGIKDGKITGIMSSFMFCNGQWNGGNYNLMYGIVRSEWNFKGVMVTDLAGGSIMGTERALCAGGVDLLLTTSYSGNQRSAFLRCDTIKELDDGIGAMKTAVKHILYTQASAALNRDVEAEEVNTALVTALYVIANVVGYGGGAVLAGFFIYYLVKDTKRAPDGDAEENGEDTGE